mmetsp:Transcript_1768/g.6024  ORF Transcript_1768/g.6024 Transcript_1768/m.6024 type:complete len:83 (+) Transcript_1768:585-833(+)
MVWFDVPAWDSKRDELDGVVETVRKRMHRQSRAGAASAQGKRKRSLAQRPSRSSPEPPQQRPHTSKRARRSSQGSSSPDASQ